MSTLQAIQIDENTTIFIEASDEPTLVSTLPSQEDEEEEEVQRGGRKGIFPGKTPSQQTLVQMGAQNLENTIRYYTVYMLQAFRKVAIAEVKNVTLEFGVNMSGMTGIPYIASGTAGCNVKVTVSCSFEEAERKEEGGGLRTED